MLKIAFKSLLKIILLLLASAVIGTLLLSAAYSIPTGRIWRNVARSVEQIAMEGDHYSVFAGLHFTDLDNYTDADYMNEALVGNDAKGLFTGLYGIEYENSLLPSDLDSPVLLLKNVFQDDAELVFKEQYRRFWNGYEVPVKILLSFFTYGRIRYINYFAEIILLSLMALLMQKRGLTRFAVPFFISFLLLGPVTMASSMTFSGFLYCTYTSCILMLIFNDKLKSGQRYPLFFMTVGIAIAYFNVNYFQLVSFGYAFVLYCLLNGFPKSAGKAFSVFGLFFIYWLIGFAGMYAMKWIFYEMLTGQPIISDMIVRTLYRVSATAYYTGPPISRSGAMLKNLRYLLINIPWIFVEICYIIWVMLPIIKGKDRIKISGSLRNNTSALILLFMMTALVLLRYLVFANHVYVHAWVTYRIADSAVLLFNVVIMQCASEASMNNEKIPVADKI